MKSHDRREWRVELPALHQFNVTLDKLFRAPNRRAWLLDRAMNYLAEEAKKDAAYNRWRDKRKNYFERDIFRPGNSKLRDASKPIKGRVWDHYHHGLNRSELAAVPKSIRRAVYFTYKPDARTSRDRLCRERCLSDWSMDRDGKPVRSHGGPFGAIHVSAWTPPELVDPYDESKKSHLPLPLENIKRDYTISEICFAFCILHDADGGLSPFVPSDHPLSENSQFELWRLNVGSPPNPPSDNWVPSLETLLPRIESELEVLPAAKCKRRVAGRPQGHDRMRDDRIAADWCAARVSGALKADFAKSKGMTQVDLDRTLARVRERKSRAKK